MLEGLLAAHRRYDELSAQLSQPDAASDIGRYRALMKEYKELEPLSRQYLALAAAEEALAEAKELLYSHDAELSAMAAEQKARTTYDNILRLIDDPDVIAPIRFLREREIVHYQRFGEALRMVQDDRLSLSV
mgnify:CR=1 FL=1